jgi:hypothetical protein
MTGKWRCKKKHPFAHKHPRCVLPRGHGGDHQGLFKTKRTKIKVVWNDDD